MSQVLNLEDAMSLFTDLEVNTKNSEVTCFQFSEILNVLL